MCRRQACLDYAMARKGLTILNLFLSLHDKKGYGYKNRFTMNKLHVGDRIRFLNSVGGGTVKGFLNKNMVIVEDEFGFDVPVLISECIAMEQTNNEKLAAEDNIPQKNEKTEQKPFPKVDDVLLPQDIAIETKEGEKITVCIAYLPTDTKKITNTSYEAFLVNDSNYYLFFNYMSRENDVWISRYNGTIEPNTKMFLEEFDSSQLNEIEKVCVQFIAFKHNKSYRFKTPYSVELRIDTTKFYKLHTFQENDYFDESALIYHLVVNDVPEREMLVSAADLQRAIQEKEIASKRPRKQPIKRKKEKDIIEVDLHIDQLLDTTAGMTNADILQYQLSKFNQVMQENRSRKNRKIVFIHGKGNGVLKNALLNEFKRKYKSCYIQDASFKEYGFGATMITIR